MRSEIVEDLKLSQLVKAQRLGLCVAHGTDVVKLRMYDSAAVATGWLDQNFHVALGPLKYWRRCLRS